MISIKGLNKGDVLAALFNSAKTQGMGFIHYQSDHVMDSTEAEVLLAQQSDFDYVEGRVIKVDLSGDEFDPGGYDRDNGQGSAARLVNTLR